MSAFLGPHGKATVILMTAHFESELPKLKDLKKLLHIPDGRYYKSGGRNYAATNRLERLLGVLSQIKGEERDWQRYNSSDYLITVAEVHSNLFMTLKYSAQVIDGFNLTDACMDELEQLMSAYNGNCSMKGDVSNMWATLERNKDRAIKLGITDTTILNPDIPGLQQILQGYGDAEYLKATSDLKNWYDTYRWKVGSPSSRASSDESVDETETA
jgi:hypothetical protein